MISAVSVVQNYFASTGEGLKNANRGGGCPSYAPGCVGAQAYGPLELRPLCDGRCAGAPRNITAFADVVRARSLPLGCPARCRTWSRFACSVCTAVRARQLIPHARAGR